MALQYIRYPATGGSFSSLGAFGSTPDAKGATLAAGVLQLQPFDSTHPGEVPSSGGGTTNFLRADGSWAMPPGTISSLGAVGSSPNANAAVISSGVLSLEPFDSTHPGVVKSSASSTSFLRGDNTFQPVLTDIGSVVPSGTSGSILYLDGSHALAQDNSKLYWDDTSYTLAIGSTGLGPIWSPNSHQRCLQLSGDGGGLITDYGVLAFSSTSDGVIPYTRGAIKWVNNVPASPGTADENVIAMFSYDGLSADSGYDGFSFYANDIPGTNLPTKFLNISWQPNAGNPLTVFHADPAHNQFLFDSAGVQMFSFTDDVTYGVFMQAGGSYVKIDASNAGTFGGIESLERSCYKYGFFGTGGVTIGGASDSWIAPPQLLSVKGDAAAAYAVYFNTAAVAASGLLCGITSAGAGQLLHQGAFSLSLGVNNTVAYTITTGNTLQNALGANEATGGGSALLGTNCPAVTVTAPYTWIKMISSDGSTVYVPAYK